MASIKSRADLRARFQKNKIPTEADFANLIESGINLADDGIKKNQGEALQIKGEKDQEVLAFYKSLDDSQATWKISQKKGDKPGLNIATGAGTTRLFIDENTGLLEVSGTVKITGHHIQMNEQGSIIYGDGAVASTSNNDPGLFSTKQGIYMKFATKNAPVLFYTNPGEGEVASGLPNVSITPNGNLCVGPEHQVPQLITGPVLQIGKDNPDHVSASETSDGQLLIARASKTGNRVYKFGVNSAHQLSIGDYGQHGGHSYIESLTIEPETGRTSIKRGLDVSGLVTLNGEVVTGTNPFTVNGEAFMRKKFNVDGESVLTGKTTIHGEIITGANPLTVNGEAFMRKNFNVDGESILKGKTTIHGETITKGIQVQGALKWGTANVALSYPGIYSTVNGTQMQLATVNAAILFHNNKADEAAGSGKPSMMINALKNVGIGTESILVQNGPVLQIGDDGIDNSNGQLILAKRSAKGNRAFKFGISEDNNLSIGDLEWHEKSNRSYTEFLRIDCGSGKTLLKNQLTIGGMLSVGFQDGHQLYKETASYMSYAWDGMTNFVTSIRNGNGGFNFYLASGDGNPGRLLAHLNAGGNFEIPGDITAKNVRGSSDIRVKRNITPANAGKDLALLNRLGLAEFDFLQTTKGGEHNRGVIAQELEKLIPEAVSTHIDFVADIFAAPLEMTMVGEKVLFTMESPHSLTDGDTVRFNMGNSDKDCEVIVVDENSFEVEGTVESFKDVLVYGKRVNDFRRVNYNHLFTLNLSATQELSRKIDLLMAWKASLEKNMVLAD